MARVKMNFRNLPVVDQIERSRLIQGRMTGNIHYPSPNPSIAQLRNATDALEVMYNQSRNRDMVKMALMRLRRKDMLDIVRGLAGYVRSESGGDEEKILSSGFDVVKSPGPHPSVETVVNLRLQYTDYTGKLKVRWNKLNDVRVYVIELARVNESPRSFTVAGYTGKTSFELTNLIPGEKYEVRVAGIGKDGKGNYSAPIVKMAV